MSGPYQTFPVDLQPHRDRGQATQYLKRCYQKSHPFLEAGSLKTLAFRNDTWISSVDVGQVNERTFVNNSSLGTYPSIVSERERLQRTGFQKWVALLVASFKVLRRLPPITVRLKIDGKSLVRTTHFVFVGNNEYEIEGTKLGTRRRLDAGHLVLYIADTKT